MKTIFVMTNNFFNAKKSDEIKETEILLPTPETFEKFTPPEEEKPPPGWGAEKCSWGLN
jgi:hypothetical protein